jgi:hypothetical protein
MRNPAQFGDIKTSAVETPTDNSETTMQSMRRFFVPEWISKLVYDNQSSA